MATTNDSPVPNPRSKSAGPRGRLRWWLPAVLVGLAMIAVVTVGVIPHNSSVHADSVESINITKIETGPSVGAGKIHIAWTHNLGPKVHDKWSVYYRKQGTSSYTETHRVDDPNYSSGTIKDLSDGVTYELRVAAHDCNYYIGFCIYQGQRFSDVVLARTKGSNTRFETTHAQLVVVAGNSSFTIPFQEPDGDSIEYRLTNSGNPTYTVSSEGVVSLKSGVFLFGSEYPSFSVDYRDAWHGGKGNRKGTGISAP